MADKPRDIARHIKKPPGAYMARRPRSALDRAKADFANPGAGDPAPSTHARARRRRQWKPTSSTTCSGEHDREMAAFNEEMDRRDRERDEVLDAVLGKP
jgi:hypothetical protein